MMNSIVEEMQLLGLWEETTASRKSELTSQFFSAVRGLLDLYHSTFQEKKVLEESLCRQAAEMKDLKDNNRKLQNECSKQATLITRMKLKEDNLLAKIETCTLEYNQLRKKGVQERLKWERQSNLEKISLRKQYQEISSCKGKVGKICCWASMSAKEKEEFLECGSMHIINNHMKRGDNHNKNILPGEEIFRKTIRRLDASQRHLVEESASIASSLKVIHSSILSSINALKVYFAQEGKPELLESLKSKNQAANEVKETSSWLPHYVSCIYQKSVELDELAEALLKNSPSTTGGVAEGAAKKFISSFCEYENVLDNAFQKICLNEKEEPNFSLLDMDCLK